MVISKGYPIFIKELIEGIIDGNITAAAAKENTYTIFNDVRQWRTTTKS